MAKVYGQDIPSKHYDSYCRHLSKGSNQSHQPYGKSVKKGAYDFPGYPFHPKFASPAQLYVRAVFKAATICWHLQPDAGGAIKPDLGPIPKEWWEDQADLERTFGYRKFMRDTLIQSFRIGEPTWCMPYLIPATTTVQELPNTNFCEAWNLIAKYLPEHKNSFIYVARPPQDVGKEFLYLYCWHVYPLGKPPTYIDARLPDLFVFDPCTLTWATQPRNILTLSRLIVLDPGWHRFYVGTYERICLRIYFPWFDVLDHDFYGGLVFYGPNSPEVTLRPFFSAD